MPASKPVFVRDATGLVRELGFLDQFVLSQAIIVILNGFVLTALFAPYFFPGAHLGLVFLLGSIPAFAMAAVYSKLSAAIPRSGGDYVWSSRILGPLFGSVQFVFLFITTVIIGVGLSTYSIVTIAISQWAFTMGVTTNNSGLISLASTLSAGCTLTSFCVGWAVAAVILVLETVVSLFSLRVFSTFQRVCVGLFLIINVGFIVLLFTVNPTTFPALFDHAMQVAGSNATYNGIIQQASQSGFAGTQFSFTNTALAAIPWGFLTFTGFNFGAYLAGETKNVKTSITRALFLSVIVTIIALLIMAQMVYTDFGSTFLNSASYVQANNAASLPTLPTTTMLLSLTSPFAAFFLGLGLTLGWVVVCVAYVVTIARMFFAAAFDRLLPAKFAEINERFHSPQAAILLVSFIWFLFITFLWYAGFAVGWLTVGIIPPIGYMLPFVAALLFPFVRKDLFKRTVGAMGQAPVIIIGSLVGIGAFLFYIIALTFPLSGALGTVYLGTNITLAGEAVVALTVIGLLIYGTAKIRLGRMGLNISAAYKEIPPE
jgi:APA family basic amino acid/polyamine antiporter